MLIFYCGRSATEISEFVEGFWFFGPLPINVTFVGAGCRVAVQCDAQNSMA